MIASAPTAWHNIELTRQTQENAARKKLARGRLVPGGASLPSPAPWRARPKSSAAFAARGPRRDFLNRSGRRHHLCHLPTSAWVTTVPPRRMFFTSSACPLPSSLRPQNQEIHDTNRAKRQQRHQHRWCRCHCSPGKRRSNQHSTILVKRNRRQRSRVTPVREIRADYSGRGPNCNAARPPFALHLVACGPPKGRDMAA